MGDVFWGRNNSLSIRNIIKQKRWAGDVRVALKCFCVYSMSNTRKKEVKNLARSNGAPGGQLPAMMLSLTHTAYVKFLVCEEENSSSEAEAAGLLYPAVTPSQKLPAPGMTSSHNMTRNWQHFFGMWKLFRSSAAETGILMGPQLYKTEKRT